MPVRTAVVALLALAAGVVLLAPEPSRAQSAAAPASLSPAARADLAAIEAHLAGLAGLAARFVQTDPDGTVREGSFLMRRPGRMRFEYAPPSKVLLLADGDHFIYHDGLTLETTHIPLSATPLAFLAKPKLAFDRSVIVTGLERADGELVVRLRSADEPDGGELALRLAERPLRLSGWTVRDAQNLVTRVSLLDLDPDARPDPRRFEFRDPRLDRSGQGR